MPERRPRRDHYAVLGVPSSATAGQITSAYRRLVRSLHPDSQPEHPAAAQGLADVLAAYETLRDPGRRAAYDAGRGSPAPRAATAGRPVPVRVTRRTGTSPVRPAAPSRMRRETSSLLDAPEGLLFSVSSRIGSPLAVLPLGWDDLSFAGRVIRQWLSQTDPWPR
ncbi:J domain-containing protein [Streptomyces sp. ISL-22]|uniref:J domain-containing protein n=1 Tax=unclassified Streptomyces TaxID=2593676 RepID=UPI001BEAD03E|nr:MULTISPECIES: J domain-containing protein [unclassified Streptomyces]MBT2419000.1 J domain-containing protein [Streptomyces sp. ISL-24]MBT2437715.1 J domain-containing protein [Streptomyces sp. ISL-22]